MPEPTPRRSLAARRRTTKLLSFDDDNDKENSSLNETLYGRRQSRLFNTSINPDAIPDEPAQTPTQLVDLYQKTVELASQGKINIKNAFSIPLVERLPQVLNVIALDDKENHNLGPNFVKAGSVIDTSAKIYGFRVDALHSETQKLSGNILNTEGEVTEADRHLVNDEGQPIEENGELAESKKVARRQKNKLGSFVATDMSKITLEHEFDFRPLQAPNLCRWPGGVGVDSIYAEMVSSTMYSSSDYPLIDGFANGNVCVEERKVKIDQLLDQTHHKIIDAGSLRNVIQSNEGHDHLLGSQALREFSFNECPSGSFIDTIHESCLMPPDESIDRGDSNADDIDHDDNYNHEELVHAAIEDLTDDPSHSNEVFKNALDELSHQDPSTMHSNLGNYQSQQSAHINFPESDDIFSASFLSNMSFADQMPHLLHSKDVQSEYSYFDITKLKLFAGPNIWKYTNLLHSTAAAKSVVQHQQAPAHRNKTIQDGVQVLTGPKRYIRVDFSQTTSIEKLMLGLANHRERKAISISQSALVLRVREKNFNQMQLARKLRPLTELSNSHNFPHVDFQRLHRRQLVENIEQLGDHIDDDDYMPHDDEDFEAPLPAMEYDFIRPIHYEKIEFAKGSTSVNAKILKREILDEFTRQKQQRSCSMDSSVGSDNIAIEFSILCEHLLDVGHLSLQTDLPSAFYCMLINCNEKKLYLKTNSQRDDLFIQECPISDRRDLSTLSYSYSSHSNLSLSSLSVH